MLQATLDRLESLVLQGQVLVMTHHRLVERVREQLPELPGECILGEPCKRDTAPCIGLAALWFAQRDPRSIMLVMPSDHVIGPTDLFRAAIRQAVQVVSDDPKQLVTFGIRPTYPSSSFGYVERAEPRAGGAFQAFRVAQFHEKPAADQAQAYVSAGTFYWNSGIFVWRATTLIDHLQQHEPAMLRHLRTIAAAAGSKQFPGVFEHEFEQIAGRSIDYAVMEKSQDVVVIEAPFSWDDVGSWQAIARLHPADANGNTLQGRHLAIDTRGTMIRTSDDHLVVAIGLEDLIIVHTPDATLVARKDLEESVRRAVQELERRGWHDVL
jgi:mannose-1-phosphate guanylyltransferase